MPTGLGKRAVLVTPGTFGISRRSHSSGPRWGQLNYLLILPGEGWAKGDDSIFLIVLANWSGKCPKHNVF